MYIVLTYLLTIFTVTCAQKLANSQLNLTHGTKKQEEYNQETKKQVLSSS